MKQSLRYVFLSNINKLAYSNKHASFLEHILKNCELEMLPITCITPEINKKIITEFKQSRKLLIPIFKEKEYIEIEDFWTFHYVLFLIKFNEKPMNAYISLLNLLLNLIYSFLIKVMVPLLKKNIIYNINNIRCIAFLSLGTIMNPKMKTDNIISQGEELKLYKLKDRAFFNIIAKYYNEGNTLCEKWINAIYMLTNKQISKLSINLMFKKYKINTICKKLDQYVSNIDTICSRFDSYFKLYEFLYTFLIFNIPPFQLKTFIRYNIEITIYTYKAILKEHKNENK